MYRENQNFILGTSNIFEKIKTMFVWFICFNMNLIYIINTIIVINNNITLPPYF